MGLDETNESTTLTRYEGKVDFTQLKSEFDSEFDNLLKPLVIEVKKIEYPAYDSAGESNNSYINCETW